jgi:acetate kinase
LPKRLLTINGGSSSVKFALFDVEPQLARVDSGSIKCADSLAGADAVMQWLRERAEPKEITAIGHRIVHGGPNYLAHTLLTPAVLAELRRIAPIDPTHLPGEIELIEAMTSRFPDVPQMACFDTAFHRHLPAVASTLPLPAEVRTAEMRRFGFHGLSFEYLMQELARQAGEQVAKGRVVLAHLGAGASMAAVLDGKCIDTTMSFTPTAGLVMATRCGDLDPGVLIYLMREKKMSADQIDELLNRKSGLLGLSGFSSDMQELLAARETNASAALAVDIFCYQARKWIGALAAALGGLETLVFSGGIGENSAEVRHGICAGLQFLGAELAADRNGRNAEIISTDESKVCVRVIRTDEEITIARATVALC